MEKVPRNIAEKLNAAYGDKSATTGRTTHELPERFTICDKQTGPYAEYYEPRALLPLDEHRIADLELRGQITPIGVLEDGVDRRGRPNLVVLEGTRRVLHIAEINRRRAKGLVLDETTVGKNEPPGWVKGGPPRDPMRVRFELKRVKSVGEAQLFKLAANMGGEPESPETLAPKILLALKNNSEEAVRSTLKMGPERFQRLLAFETQLAPEAQQAVKNGRVKMDNVLDLAEVPRADQAAAVAAIPADARTAREIRDVLRDAKNGEAPRPKADRARSWTLRRLQAFRETLVEACPENKEKKVALALLDLFGGDTRAFKRSDCTFLIAALEVLDKHEAKERAKRERKAEKKAKVDAEAGVSA